ncbi:hypothetical protein [Terriglobus sp.]|uniref:hypothetical protein n=1 Tax=Terriglobus sp. TaxID=1889013 RepID=UPI003B00FF64
MADTSPLNYLIQIQSIDVLHLLYGEVLIPAAVLDELGRGPESVRAWSANLPPWVGVRSVDAVSPAISISMGRGEREAIHLAKVVDAELILIDEQQGRLEAER